MRSNWSGPVSGSFQALTIFVEDVEQLARSRSMGAMTCSPKTRTNSKQE